ncbi:MAG TPA: ABC transporter ATP-binding protein [Burkholderiales bacterium]
MARIRFAGLAKRFDAQAVLAPLDLEIADGEFFTFVGPSGCGKSTLLNLIAGVEAPSAGELWFDGARVDTLAPGARDVAMVFQSYALYPHLSVRDNIAFPLRVRGAPRGEIEGEVGRVAQVLGLSSLLKRKPRELSGGQRQRVALGRALVRKPRVFLMDEPLSNLDARLRLEMREELKRLHEAHGITTVYVTHDQEEAMALSQRVAVLNAGRIEQCGPPSEIYADPANLFVAQFLGSPPLNVLEGASPEVVLGVRPADVLAHGAAREGATAARVSVLEPTGSDLWVSADWNGRRIKARAAPGAVLERGATVYLEIPRERLYAFDRATGKRLRGMQLAAHGL